MTLSAAVPEVRACEEAGPMARITVERCEGQRATEWRAFLADSNNGTLFCDLAFLAYHPAECLDTQHLMFRRAGELLALLPAAIVHEADGRAILKSPYRASVGGCVLPQGQGIDSTVDVIRALQDYARSQRLNSVELRMGPNVYAEQPNDNLAFALIACGFALVRRWLCHIVPLPADPARVVESIPTGSRRRYARYALRQGVVPVEAGAERIEEFYRILAANRAKHGAQPTHTLAELRDIFALVPDRVRLFLFTLEQTAIAGALVFELNRHVAYQFYLCHDERFEKYRATSLAVAHVMEYYAGRGFRYLDLGPSTFDDLTINRGLAVFKEEMGAVGFCRETYRWEVRPDAE